MTFVFRMSRVLFITDFFRPEPGGLEGLFATLVQSWPDQEISVFVTSSKNHYIHDVQALLEFDMTQSYPVFRRDWHSGRSPSEETTRLQNLFYDFIKKEKISHVLLGNLSDETMTGATAAKEAGIGWSVILNGSDLKKQSGIFNSREREILTTAMNVFALSKEIARMGRKFGVHDARLYTIPPVMVPRWKHSPQAPQWFKEFVGDHIAILGVGPLLPRKGFDRAIRMIDHIQDLKSMIKVVIIGSGPEYQFLQELVSGKGLENTVLLKGFVDDRELGGVYARSQILIQPGYLHEDDTEGMSMTLMEAASFGIPVIAGSCGAVNEIVVDGETGFLIDPGNALQAADRLRHLVFHPGLLKKMGKNAKNRSRNTFHIEKAVALFRDTMLK